MISAPDISTAPTLTRYLCSLLSALQPPVHGVASVSFSNLATTIALTTLSDSQSDMNRCRLCTGLSEGKRQLTKTTSDFDADTFFLSLLSPLQNYFGQSHATDADAHARTTHLCAYLWQLLDSLRRRIPLPAQGRLVTAADSAHARALVETAAEALLQHYWIEALVAHHAQITSSTIHLGATLHKVADVGKSQGGVQAATSNGQKACPQGIYPLCDPLLSRCPAEYFGRTLCGHTRLLLNRVTNAYDENSIATGGLVDTGLLSAAKPAPRRARATVVACRYTRNRRRRSSPSTSSSSTSTTEELSESDTSAKVASADEDNMSLAQLVTYRGGKRRRRL